MTERCPRTSDVVRENSRTLVDLQERRAAAEPWPVRFADRVAGLAGSMTAVGLHVVWFAAWITLNAGLAPGVAPWDPFPFVLLTGITSIEAIFLTLFILISQNRMSAAADRREELDIQVNLLTEHELTRALRLLDAIATKLGIEHPGEACDHVRLDRVLKTIEEAHRHHDGAP